jgi:hypothetical protein
VKSEVTDLGKTVNSSSADISAEINFTKDRSAGGPQDVVAGAAPVRAATPFDVEAT